MKYFYSFLLSLAITVNLMPQVYSQENELPSILSGKLSPKKNSEASLGTVNFEKDPTYIKSDSLSLQTEERVFTYTGNVEVQHGNITMTCKILEGKYNEKNRIEEIIAKENVVVTRGTTIARGGRAVYNAVDETIVLTENPELEDEGSVLTADRVIIYLAEDRSSAEGQVRVKLVSRPE